MAKYSIQIKKTAQKEISTLPKKDLKVTLKAIEELLENPSWPHCKKLSGEEKYRKRVGRYRILYGNEQKKLIIIVVKVAHRKDVYRP